MYSANTAITNILFSTVTATKQDDLSFPRDGALDHERALYQEAYTRLPALLSSATSQGSEDAFMPQFHARTNLFKLSISGFPSDMSSVFVRLEKREVLRRVSWEENGKTVAKLEVNSDGDWHRVVRQSDEEVNEVFTGIRVPSTRRSRSRQALEAQRKREQAIHVHSDAIEVRPITLPNCDSSIAFDTRVKVTVTGEGMDNKHVPLFRFIVTNSSGQVLASGHPFFLLNRGTKQDYLTAVYRSLSETLPSITYGAAPQNEVLFLNDDDDDDDVVNPLHEIPCMNNVSIQEPQSEVPPTSDEISNDFLVAITELLSNSEVPPMGDEFSQELLDTTTVELEYGTLITCDKSVYELGETQRAEGTDSSEEFLREEDSLIDNPNEGTTIPGSLTDPLFSSFEVTAFATAPSPSRRRARDEMDDDIFDDTSFPDSKRIRLDILGLEDSEETLIFPDDRWL